MTGEGGLRVAVLNRGSSTLKFASFVGTSAGDLVEEARGVVRVDDGVAAEDGLHEARNAMKKATTGAGPFDLVGHRVVHGGDGLCAPTLVEPWVEEEVRRWSVLAPLHNRAALGVIQAARSVFPEAAQVAVLKRRSTARSLRPRRPTPCPQTCPDGRCASSDSTASAA